jgi:hypothetical protein
MTKPHKATHEHWEFLRRWAADGGNTATALVELRSRVEALEAAEQHQDKLDRLIAQDRADAGAGGGPMSQPLSPAAQAVLDAIQDVLDATAEVTPRTGSVAAAALRAAADQVVPKPLMIVEGGRTYEEAWTATVHDDIRRRILAIAAELEDKQ